MENCLSVREFKEHYRIGGVRLPKRDGGDYENSFVGHEEGSIRRLIFVLRHKLIVAGYAGENYRRGIV